MFESIDIPFSGNCMVAVCVAHSKKPFTIAEELILPGAVDMC